MTKSLFSGILIWAVGCASVSFLCSGCAEVPLSLSEIPNLSKRPFSTRYGPHGFFGGYKSKKISEDTYRVSFWFNKYTDSHVAKGYLLYHCAEITIQQNMNYFVIQQQKEDFLITMVECVIQILEDKPHVSEGVYDAHEVSQLLHDWIYK